MFATTLLRTGCGWTRSLEIAGVQRGAEAYTEAGLGMTRARTLRAAAGAMLSTLVVAPALAQEASRDRAEFDAAAGRVIFQNVLLSDPQAFSARPRSRTRDQRVANVEAPAAAGEASADRHQLDAAAGRPVFHSASPVQPAPTLPREQAPGTKQRNVRVILASPYGQ
jgi:hypothetical protein